jgi:hypothetical protein
VVLKSRLGGVQDIDHRGIVSAWWFSDFGFSRGPSLPGRS